MRRLILLLCPLLIVGCGEDTPPFQPTSNTPAASVQSTEPTAPSTPPLAPQEEPGEGPADTLRHYYALIEAGDNEEAWRMRSEGGAGLADFARNFERYRSHRATVGAPSPQAQAGGWAYVEVPVQIFGTLKDGEPFGAAGSVTMRRSVGASTRAAPEQGWHIYTGD